VAYSLKGRTVESQQPAVTRKRPVNNKGTVFSTRSVPRYYEENLGFSYSDYSSVVAKDKYERNDLPCKAWTDRGLVHGAQGRIFNNMLYVRYVHLTKAKLIHKREIHPLVRKDVT
jgi:hypothetical protein